MPSEDPSQQSELSDAIAIPSEGKEISLTVGGQEISVAQMAAAFAALDQPDQMAFLRKLLPSNADFQMFYSTLLILSTETAFDDEKKREILEKVATTRSFAQYLSDKGKEPIDARRSDLIDWWEIFTNMASMSGYEMQRIDTATTEGQSLWLATRNLSEEMRTSPEDYLRLPGHLANHASEVTKVLSTMKSARAFITLLIGEAWEDIVKSPKFLRAFLPTSSERAQDIVQEELAQEVIWQISIILNRGEGEA